MGKKGDARLMAELTGRYSNLLLLDEQGRIIDALKRACGPNVPRQLLPGKDYQLPIRSTPATTGCAANKVEKPEMLSWNQYVEKLYSNRQQPGGAGDLPQQLQKIVTRQIKKLKKRQAHIEQDLQVQENAEQLKQAGDLLLANRWRLEKGQEALEADNFYTESADKITIPLDLLLTPQQNIDKYFQRYKKAKRGVAHSRRRLRETVDELHWLEELDYQLSETVKDSDSEEILAELKGAGLWRTSSKLHARRTQPQSSFHETYSPSGFKILWGRNNRQNDELSTSRLKAGDLWFHVHQAAGAHVVLKSGSHNQQVSEADVAYAAAIAAGYSKLRRDSKVEVMRAEAGAVSKPKGVRPGLVRVKNYKTLLVEPQRRDE
jgi:predicted ribosome quality control (RQC) complex YloA/Tae2 family protein